MRGQSQPTPVQRLAPRKGDEMLTEKDLNVLKAPPTPESLPCSNLARRLIGGSGVLHFVNSNAKTLNKWLDRLMVFAIWFALIGVFWMAWNLVPYVWEKLG